MYSSTSLQEEPKADVRGSEDTQGTVLFQKTLAVSRSYHLEESVRSCFSELILQNKATVAVNCNTFVTLISK